MMKYGTLFKILFILSVVFAAFLSYKYTGFNKKSAIVHGDVGFGSPWVPEPGRGNFGDNIPKCISVDEVIKVLRNVDADDFKSFEEAHIIMKKANERGICK